MTLHYDAVHAPPCAGGAQPGMIAVEKGVLERWKDASTVGIFNCRRINHSEDPNDPFSRHADGCALDLHGSNEILDAIASWLAGHAEILGIQDIMWNGMHWRVGKGWAAISAGNNQHTDHLHCEQNDWGAEHVTIDIVRSCFSRTPPPAPAVPPEDDNMKIVTDTKRTYAVDGLTLTQFGTKREHDSFQKLWKCPTELVTPAALDDLIALSKRTI